MPYDHQPQESVARSSLKHILSKLIRGSIFCGGIVETHCCGSKCYGGKPVIRGTRLTVDLILELLASGMASEEIAKDYKISVEDVRAALLYAAKILEREEIMIAETET
jgi:uncharacterized protein (DUF433 family)